MRCRYYCHYSTVNGVGRAARDYLAALALVPGVELEIAVLGSQAHGLASPEPRYSHLDRFARPADDALVGTPDVAIYQTTPRVLETLGPPRESVPTKRIALATWETNRLPARNAEVLRQYDAVIVPSEFCAGVITDGMRGASVIPRQVIVVPHCFDEEFWPRTSDVRPRELDSMQMVRFYSVNAWGERKNVLGIIRAYLAAFTKDDKVEMLLVIDKPDFDEIKSVIARSGMRPEDLPRLHINDPAVDGPLDEDDLVSLHEHGDCYVSATRGEGWGLGLFEAAIMGRDIVSAGWSGELDYLHNYPAWYRVQNQMTPCFGGTGHVEIVEKDGQRYRRQTIGIPHAVDCKQSWSDPDLTDLADSMRHVYEGRGSSTREELRTSRAVLEARFGYKVVGPQLANTLRGIAWGTHSAT